MRFRRAVPEVARHLCFRTLIVVVLASGAGVATAAWAEGSQSEPSPASVLELIKTSVDEIEAALGREDITAEELAGVREKLNTTTDSLHTRIDELEPKHMRPRSGSSSSVPPRQRTRRRRARK